MHRFSRKLRHADKQAATHQSLAILFPLARPISVHAENGLPFKTHSVGERGRIFQSINSLEPLEFIIIFYVLFYDV
jgi:hypothetical protein